MSALRGPMEASTRGSSGAQQSRSIDSKKKSQLFFSLRTDSQNNHINGEGNIGFCCSNCELIPRSGNTTQGDTPQRSKFVQEQDDRVKLPDDSAVVFGQEVEERRIPPS